MRRRKKKNTIILRTEKKRKNDTPLSIAKKVLDFPSTIRYAYN
jgi:hypothetical protein